MQSICEEATYLTIAHDFDSYSEWENKVDAIIEKYRPAFIPEKAPECTKEPWPVIRYEIIIYNGFEEMLKDVPYGGHSVYYPRIEIDEPARRHYSFCTGSDLIAVNGMECNGIKAQLWVTKKWYDKEINPANYVFVLTFSCNFPFSSSLVKWLFNGGVNTVVGKKMSGYNGVARGERSTKYILWSRGAGVINAK